MFSKKFSKFETLNYNVKKEKKYKKHFTKLIVFFSKTSFKFLMLSIENVSYFRVCLSSIEVKSYFY